MTDADRIKWDSRYSSDLGNLSPSSLVAAHIAKASPGRALDIACGNGRNSIFLAQRGFAVDAVDISSIALQAIGELEPRVNTSCKDLDNYIIPKNTYSVILNANFLFRPLFPMIEAGLLPGGILIFESFAGEKTSQYCLGPNELLHSFDSLQVIFYEEQDLPESEKFEKSVQLVACKKT